MGAGSKEMGILDLELSDNTGDSPPSLGKLFEIVSDYAGRGPPL
ncbi:hypothetical protein THARTR1_03949 [Trichoderma harzianum]|uniref:Uncharacterized protein n=1 Tax=Trichoderma harzianum TaxID=5544 RepID=A0A2K0UE10_TRIHA|nr:hypothetical protein THARTR1_03949 [Trichoderma harzianum]